jgi:predicted metal-binding membrane protein
VLRTDSVECNLTTRRRGRQDRPVLLRCLRRRARRTASAIAAVLCVMAWTTCASAAQMPREQHACCAAMNHECGEMALESACCTGEAHDLQSVVALKPIFGFVPAAPVVAILPAPASSLPDAPVARAADRTSSLGPPGVPTYLFVSLLRI